MREELDTKDKLPSLAEPDAEVLRPEAPGTADFEPAEHFCVFGSEKSSSEEIGIRS